jgi:hypothetical protein
MSSFSFTRARISIAALAALAMASAPVAAQAKVGGPPQELFYARPDGDRGPAIAYDVATGREHIRLPAGMLSADRSTFIAAEPAGGRTDLRTFDQAGGEEALLMPLSGRWSLGAVSPTGAFVALAREPSQDDLRAWSAADRWQTDLQIIDTVRRRTSHVLQLPGRFDAEAISSDGTSLFLVEQLPAARPDRYAIRWYDLSNERLVADPLRSKTADEIMTGYAWGGTASADGDWLFTLYISTDRKVAFVHLLNTRERFTVCVDLPSSSGDFEALKAYSLAYSPGRQTLYAVNPRLGTVAEIRLGEYKLDGGKFVANRVGTFAPARAPALGAPVVSALSEDSDRLYYAQGSTAFAYDLARGQLQQRLDADQTITGLAPNESGLRLWMAQRAAPPALFDTRSGKRITILDPERIT